MNLLLLLLSVLGCAPTCDQVCRKTLFDCDLSTERVALATCVDQCDRQEVLYEEWENDSLVQAFRDHRRCLMSESCEAIEAGECAQDDRLFVTDGEIDGTPFDPFAPEEE